MRERTASTNFTTHAIAVGHKLAFETIRVALEASFEAGAPLRWTKEVAALGRDAREVKYKAFLGFKKETPSMYSDLRYLFMTKKQKKLFSKRQT